MSSNKSTMLCTNCSRPVLPVVSFDIDGTMGDYHRHFIDFAFDYLAPDHMNGPGYGYTGREGFRDWFCETFGVEPHVWYDIKLAYRQGAQKRSMPAYEDMIEVAHVADAADCEMWIATTRPYLRLDNIDPDTREWLRRNRVPYDGLVFDEDKYLRLSRIVERERVVATFEDLPEQYDTAAAVFGPNVPFLVKTKWNNFHSRINQGGAQEALHHLHSQLMSWKNTNER